MAETAAVVFTGSSLKVKLPMTQPTGKIRIKRRSFFSEYGMPVASRSECLDLKCYIEWQIGYDLLATFANSQNTSLSHLKFSNYKQETKYAYELSEIIYYSHKLKLISEKDIIDTYNKIKNVTDDNLIDVIDKMRIFRTSPIETTINDMMFFEMKVSYPLIVHKFGKYDIYAEVMNRENQRGVGVQPMLYVCIPITSLKFERNPINRTLDAKESSDWVIGEEEARLSLELFRMFGMLSVKHRHDVLAILEMLFTYLK